MKKLKIMFCAGAMMLCLAACGKTQEDSNSQSTGQSGSTSGEQGSSANGQDESGALGSSGADNTGFDESQTDSTEDGWSEEMAEIRAAVVEALGENYWPNMPMDAELFEAFIGITPDMYEDYMAESPMISANVDTLVIVKAKEGMADTVEETLKAYRDSKVNDTMQYPQNIGKIQASQVVRMGNYIVFVQLGGDAVDASDEEEAIKQCKEDNELVIGIIRQYVEQ